MLGTGTDVGKTWVTAALLSALRTKHVRSAALKPIATGVDDGLGEDARIHAAALGRSESDARPPRFAYRRPVSPHWAAREEGRAIDVAAIVDDARALAHGGDYDVVVIESAGGTFSPLGPGLTNADLARALAPRLGALLLVAPDRLGVLHDLTACLMAMRAVGLPAPEVVLTTPSSSDASTGTNADEARALGIASPLATFARDEWSSPASIATADRVLAALGLT